MVAPLIIAGARIALGAAARGAAAEGAVAAGAESSALRSVVGRAISNSGDDIGSQVNDFLSDSIIEEANHIIEQIYNSAVAATPVDTGTLKAGWQMKKMEYVGDSASVWNDVEYAIYVEYDTNKTRGRYMLTNAIAGALA